jgi:hypothetical protein
MNLLTLYSIEELFAAPIGCMLCSCSHLRMPLKESVETPPFVYGTPAKEMPGGNVHRCTTFLVTSLCCMSAVLLLCSGSPASGTSLTEVITISDQELPTYD